MTVNWITICSVNGLESAPRNELPELILIVWLKTTFVKFETKCKHNVIKNILENVV